MTSSRPALDSRTTVARIMSVLDTNLHGNVHGGVILHMIDELGGAVAARHCGGRAVTASLDDVQFLVPVHVGDLVRVNGRVTWVGRTSMEVAVDVFAERWDQAGPTPLHVVSAHAVYAAIDEAGRPREVPPLVADEVDQGAEARRAWRLARRAGAGRRQVPQGAASDWISVPSSGPTR